MRILLFLRILSLWLPSTSPWIFRRLNKFRRRWHGKSIVSLPIDNSILDANDVDSHFMKLALIEAEKAASRGEVPIGAVVVRPLGENVSEGQGDHRRRSYFEVLSAASNSVEEKRDASAHAELLAMRMAAQQNKDASWRLLNSTLYTTVEPCAMCLAAAQAFRVKKIVFGAPDLRLGAIDTYVQLLDAPHPFHTIDEVVRGVKQEESANLLKDFFRKRRLQKGSVQKKHLLQSISAFFRRSRKPST